MASGLLLKHDEDKRVIEAARADCGLAVASHRRLSLSVRRTDVQLGLGCSLPPLPPRLLLVDHATDEIKAKRVERQTFDREDARLLLRLWRENNFPQIWVPGPENRMTRSQSGYEM